MLLLDQGLQGLFLVRCTFQLQQQVIEAEIAGHRAAIVGRPGLRMDIALQGHQTVLVDRLVDPRPLAAVLGMSGQRRLSRASAVANTVERPDSRTTICAPSSGGTRRNHSRRPVECFATYFR